MRTSEISFGIHKGIRFIKGDEIEMNLIEKFRKAQIKEEECEIALEDAIKRIKMALGKEK